MSQIASKLIVIKPGALGDTLLLAPGLRALRESWPGLRITVVGSAPAIDLLTYWGLADEVVAIDRLNLFAPSETERKVMNGSQVITFIPLDHEVGRRLTEITGSVEIMACPSRPARPDRHMAVHLDQCLRGCFPHKAKLSRVPFQSPGQPAHAPAGPFAILAPGAGAPAKRAPMALFTDAARKMTGQGIQPIFLAGEVETETGLIHQYPKAYPRCLNPDLKQLAGVLQRAEAAFANDSGPAHLAGLLGTVTTVFFGPSDPCVWRPWGPSVVIKNFKSI